MTRYSRGMSPAAALEPFLEARTGQSVRASASRGHEALRLLADALDNGIRALAAPVARHGLVFVALGGYGRREQCRHSDIDIMVLSPTVPSDGANAVLYPLWDTGLKVGHSVRTIADAIESARANVETYTSLLDARCIAGDLDTFTRFLEARRRMVQRERIRMTAELRQRRVHLVEAEPWQLQEPDIKTSRGGLRDLQWAHWVATADAIAEGVEPPVLSPWLAAANETLLATRHALHALSERPNDRLRQDLVTEVAEIVNTNRTDCFRRVFEAMRVVDAESARVFGGAVEERPRWLSAFWRRPPARVEERHDPADDLERLRMLLRAAVPGDLDPLPKAPWLDRLLPEWEVLRALPHIAPFHRHPADIHSFRTVVEARLATAENLEETATPQVASELPDHDELLLCALLHDIGKGHEGDHSHVGAVITERFGARVGLDPEAARRLTAVVLHHLLLPTIATRRDIADERVVREVAQAAGDARTLRLLYILGVADARASGPDVWSAWKAQLMRTLYLRALDVLEAAGPESAAARLYREAITTLEDRFSRSVVGEHLRSLPPSYLLSTPPGVIGDHLALIAEAAGATATAHDRVGDVDRLTIITPDRPGILSLVAGTLAVHNVTVLGGVAFTRDDGVAMQVMYVGDGLGHGIDDRRWSRVFEAVPQALAGQFPIGERLAETRRAYVGTPPVSIPTTVTVDNVGSDAYSIVEVTAADRLGLLYAITSTMHSLALDIHVAKVDTIGREVVDAFYVRRNNGRRIEAPDEILRLRTRIIEAVTSLDAN